IDTSNGRQDEPNPARSPAPTTPSAPSNNVPQDKPAAARPASAPDSAPATPVATEDAEDEPKKPVPATAVIPGGADPGPVKPTPEAPPRDEYSGLPSGDTAPAVPGLAGPLWSIPGVVPSNAAPKPAPTTIAAAPTVPSDVASRVLSGTLHSRDKSMGIEVPAAGVVTGSIANALRNSALTDTKGTFEVKLSGEGNVESVRFMGSSDGDASQWAAVAEAARKSLAGRVLQMGPDKQGVTVVVKVESKVQYPAGTKERVDIKPVCANEVIEQAVAAIEGAMQTGGMVRGVRDDQGRFIPYSELDDERRSRFCIPIGIRAVVDPANIGAHMTNVVSSSFQVKRAGEQALPAEAAMPIDRGVPWLPVAEGKTRPPPPPPKKKKKRKPRRGSVVPVEINR
ncbi:MAG TPA: hypothetical protein PK156_43510, partial [Polyangium sp.]|nr:hypothetical protein [Polyangium sp.]